LLLGMLIQVLLQNNSRRQSVDFLLAALFAPVPTAAFSSSTIPLLAARARILSAFG
jgi:hypothetical protein